MIMLMMTVKVTTISFLVIVAMTMLSWSGLEFMGPSERTFAGSMMMLLWLIGPFLVGGVSYIVSDWRWIQVLSAAPFIFCMAFWWSVVCCSRHRCHHHRRHYHQRHYLSHHPHHHRYHHLYSLCRRHRADRHHHHHNHDCQCIV